VSVNLGALAGGVIALLIGIAILRSRAAVAEWQIANRINSLRRSSLLNSEYVEREVHALTSEGSRRLSRVLVTLVGVVVLVGGVIAVVAGLTAG
jgi:uncharacterized membrane protein